MKSFLFYLFLITQFQFIYFSYAQELPRCRCSDENSQSQQIECDETKNEFGAGKCLNRCQCSKGRICKWPPHHAPTGVCTDPERKEND